MNQNEIDHGLEGAIHEGLLSPLEAAIMLMEAEAVDAWRVRP